MEQELLGLVQAVKDVAPQVWTAARLAVISGAVVDVFAGVVGFALCAIGWSAWYAYQWDEDDRPPAMLFGAVIGGMLAACSGVYALNAIRHLIAPDWYTIQLLLSQLPGNGG
jgi:hypothetical protein